MKHLWKLALCLALLVCLAALGGGATALAEGYTITYNLNDGALPADEYAVTASFDMPSGYEFLSVTCNQSELSWDWSRYSGALSEEPESLSFRVSCSYMTDDGTVYQGEFTGIASTLTESGTVSMAMETNGDIKSFDLSYTYSCTPGAPGTFTAEDLPLTLPTPTRENNLFRGWYDNQGLSGSPITAIPEGTNQNVTLYAAWTPVTAVSTWEGLATALSAGGAVKLTAHVEAASGSSDLVVPEDKTAVLDLNGYTIDGGSLSPVIEANGGLTLMDSGNGGGITGSGNGVVSVVGSCEMTGGTVSGSGEEAVYVATNGSFILSGGTVSGSGEQAVYVDTNGSFILSGAPVIEGSVYMYKSVITLGGELTYTEPIAVKRENEGTSFILTGGWGTYMNGKDPAKYFTGPSDDNLVHLAGNSEAALEKILTWSELREALWQDGTVTLYKDYTAVSGDGMLVVYNGKSVTLDLNGHTLDISATGSSLAVQDNGSLTLKDSVGGGAVTSSKIGAVIVVGGVGSGSFKLESGTVSNSNDGSACVVTVKANSSFEMSGGTVSGSGNQYGVVDIEANGGFTLSGGTVSGSGKYSVYVEKNGGFTLSGGPAVSGCVYLENSVITLGGKLTNASPIQVSLVGGAPGTFTGGWADQMGAASPADYFTCENPYFTVSLDENEGAMVPKTGVLSVTTWAQMGYALKAGGEIRLDEHITAGTNDKYLTVPEGVTAMLNLNGHTIDGTVINESTNDYVLEVDGTLTLGDSAGGGKVIGQKNISIPCTVFVAGSLTMTGGTVSGGGIFGGVFVPNGSVTLSGAPVIEEGVTLYESVITLGGPLTCASPIPVVIMELSDQGATVSAAGVFTSGWSTYMSGKKLTDTFTAADDSYRVRLTNGEAELYESTLYTISMDGITNGTVTATVEGETVTQAEAWDGVTLTVEPNTGYVLGSLTATYTDSEGNTQSVGGLEQGTGDDADKWTFAMPAGDVTVTASFRKLCTLTLYGVFSWTEVTATVNGQPAALSELDEYGWPVLHVVEGDAILLTVTPIYAIHIDSINGWTIDGSLNITVTDADEGAKTAAFTVPAQNVNVNIGLRGNTIAWDTIYDGQTVLFDVTPNLSAACEGDAITLTVTKDASITLDALVLEYWDGQNGQVSQNLEPNGDGVYSFTMPDTSVSIKSEVRLTGRTYAIDSTGLDDSAWPYVPCGKDEYNTYFVQAATANAGDTVRVYIRKGTMEDFKVTGADGTPVQTEYVQEDSGRYYTFTMPAQNIALTGTAAYSIRIHQGGLVNGSLSIAVNGEVQQPDENGTFTAHADDSVTVTAMPDPGYRLVNLSYDPIAGGDETLLESGKAFTMPAEGIELNVSFATSWGILQEQINSVQAGGTVTLTEDVTALAGEAYLTVSQETPAFTLDLNGHTIDRHLSSAVEDGYVIVVAGTMTLTDSKGGGAITGGYNLYGGGGIWVMGTLNMQGGAITGNVTENTGGGVLLSNSSSVFNFTGGTITGNTANGANKNAAGVFVGVGVMNVSGSPVANDAVWVDNYGDYPIHVNGALTETARITLASDSTGVALTSGLSGKGTAANFVSANSAYRVRLNSDGEAELYEPTFYTVSIADNIENGAITATVNGETVTEAAEGDNVVLIAAPVAGYALDSFTVTDADSHAVTVTDDSFTMPAANVTVTATFKLAYPITMNYDATGGTVTATVNGKTVTMAHYEDEVTLTVARKPKHMAVYDENTHLPVTVTDANGETVDVLNDDPEFTFIMPAGGVTVTANFVEAEWGIIPGYTGVYPSYTEVYPYQNGSIAATVDGEPAAKNQYGYYLAKPDQAIVLTVTPANGYALVEVTGDYEDQNGEFSSITVTVDESDPNIWTFTMPDSVVYLSLSFCKVYAVTVSSATGGTVTADKTVAAEDDTVTLTVEPATGYELDTLTATDADGNAVDIDENNQFTMPAVSVTVSAAFKKIPFGTPDFTLPAALKTIEESAFEGLTKMTVVDAGSVTSIGKNAFKGCTGLKKIKLPKNCAIDKDAFSGCGTVLVYAPADGTTETFCQNKDTLIFVAE